MKKIRIIVSMLAGAAGAYAQGTLNWNDGQPGYLISILSPNLAQPYLPETGNTSWDLPAGSATYTGGWIGNNLDGGASPGGGVGATPSDGYLGINYQNAANFTIGLYLATSLPALINDIITANPLATTTLLGGGDAGLYNVGTLTYVSGFAPGTPVFVGLAAWYSRGGANSFASAVFADNTVGGFVESALPVDLGGGTEPGGGPAPPATLTGLGLTSFNLPTPFPEPSAIALGVLGASTFLMRLRIKHKVVTVQ